MKGGDYALGNSLRANRLANPQLILKLFPLGWFGIVGAELRQVDSLGEFMTVGRPVRSCYVDAQNHDLHQLATLCEELRPDSLYVRYANKKLFRHEEDFRITKDKTVVHYVKRMADGQLVKVMELADRMNIPMLYAQDSRAAMHISNRLRMETQKPVTPVMSFHRHSEGTTYRLQLRINGNLVEMLTENHPAVLTHHLGWFILDNQVYALGENFSGQLLVPFVQKKQVEIPRKMENEYFRRFIRKQMTRAEIHAEGFDITDICLQPVPRMAGEASVDGSRLLTLRFSYNNIEYEPESKSNGRVTLSETDSGFRFVRQLRNLQEEQRFTQLLRELTGEGPTIRFATLALMIDWLRKYAPALKAQGFDIVQLSNHIYYIGPLSVEQHDSWKGDWLQTDVTVVIERKSEKVSNKPAEPLRIPFLNFRDAILRGEQEYLLPTGELLLIPKEWLQRYTDLLLIGMPKGNRFQRHRSQLQGTLDPSYSLTLAPSYPLTPAPPHLGRENSVALPPYQEVGFHWLWQNFVAQTGCCLSDEMGLGKTLQTIALLLKYKEEAHVLQSVKKPMPGMLFSDEEMRGEHETTNAQAQGLHLPFRTSLVVAPASVVHNWRNELTRFAPSLTVMTYTGDSAKRKDKLKALMRWDVVLTTYRTLLNDIEQLSQCEFGIVVFDESQAFKTATSQIHGAVTQLKALHRLALSGTPVENNLQELWSLMNVLNPNLLGDARWFQGSFVHPIAVQMEETRRELLRRLIAPYFLKRTKEEVLTDLPERQEEVVVCPMTDEQAREYSEELSKARNEWLDPHVASQNKHIHILAALQRLRHIANGEGKLNVVFDYLESLRQTAHKVLLFSEYVTLLEQVGSMMACRQWSYALLTGQTQNREQVIEHFQQTASCQFFLISLKAGGVGLNLTAADYVFLLDPWWNRAAEEQAIARAHRIGQKRSVFVYRFVSADTLEEQILTLQNRKQSLIDSVLPFIL